MNSEALSYLAAKGLSLDEIIELTRLMERKKDPTNAERQARHRANRKAGKVTRYSNGVTPPIEDIHTPSPDISPNGESQTERDGCDAVAELWNAVAGPVGLARCSKMAGKRRRACLARIKADGFEQIAKAIEHVPKSAFLRGETGNWSGASIDFLLKPDSVMAILEGKYDDRQPRQQLQPTNGFAGVRGKRPNPALDMVLEAERELQAEAERENPWPDWPPGAALPAH